MNVYGPGDRHFSRIVPRTVRQLLRHDTVRLSRSSGATILDFLYVDDAVAGLRALAERVMSSGGDVNADVFNFGIGVGPTAATDHLLIKGILGRRFDWGRKGDAEHRAIKTNQIL